MVMNILRTNWLFLVILIASVGLLGFGHASVAPIGEQAQSLQDQALQQESSFVGKVVQDAQTYDGMPANLALADKRTQLARLEEVVAALARQVNYVVAPQHEIPSELDTPDRIRFYTRARAMLEDRFLERYIPRRWSDRLNSNDMGYAFEVTPGEGSADPQQMLRRLDLVERVARQAIASDLTKVTKFRFVDGGALPESVRVRIPSIERKRNARRMPGARVLPGERDNAEDQASGPQPMLGGIVMEVQMRGTSEEIWRFLLGLQQSREGNLEGRSLGIEEISIKRNQVGDGQDGVLEASATLIAYEVNLSAELPEASKLAALKRAFPEKDFSNAGGDADGRRNNRRFGMR